MNRIFLAALAFAAVSAAARADEAMDLRSKTSPEVLALSQMTGECQRREASALVQAYAAQLALAEATKRADAAEKQVADLKAQMAKTATPEPTEPAPDK